VLACSFSVILCCTLITFISDVYPQLVLMCKKCLHSCRSLWKCSVQVTEFHNTGKCSRICSWLNVGDVCMCMHVIYNELNWYGANAVTFTSQKNGVIILFKRTFFYS
jgi:hypothetical protein